MVCPCCKQGGSQVTRTLEMKNRRIFRFRRCFTCEKWFVTEEQSYERLRLVMINTENGQINDGPFIPEKVFIKSWPLRLIKGKPANSFGKKNVLNFFLNKPFI